MAFQQLYYTSCEHGLLGYGGFQFNAATPGVSPVVMREVEDRTSYEPPRSMPADPGQDQLADYPVAFSHSQSSGGSAITARVVFAGNDYSGRPGNYFAHVLVNQSATDFGPVLPVELWDAPLWQTTPVEARELPSLPGPPARGPLDRAGVQAFLEGSDPRVLPALLTAVGRSMAGDRPVLLAGPDCATNTAWIAAVSYLLGEGLGRRMSFTTYSHRPAYSQHHLVGVLSGSDTVPADQSFYVYDASTGRLPDLPVHPLAALLARSGVIWTEPLWQQALALAAPGALEDFDGWHPPVAAAAALMRVRLAPADVAAAVSWLSTAQDVPADAGPVLLALLEQQDEPFSDDQLRDLHAMAVGLGVRAATEKLELTLVERAYARLERAEPAGLPVGLTSPSAQEEAHERCVAALDSLPAEAIPDLLRWTADAGVELIDGEFREYGGYSLAPSTRPELLAAILDGRPHIREGFVNRLARNLDEASDFFAVTGIVGFDDLGTQPALAERWLTGAPARGELSALDAFHELRKIRGQARRAVDAELLTRLWPAGCPSGDLCELLPYAVEMNVGAWFADALARALQTDADGSIGLAKALDDYPRLLALLPAGLRQSAGGLSRVDVQLKTARGKVRRGDSQAFAPLYRAYEAGDVPVRKLLKKEIPGLLCEAERLEEALRRCPLPVRSAFCREAGKRLDPLRVDNAPLAARLFLAVLDLGDRGHSAAARELEEPLKQVLKWSGGQRRQLRKALGSSAGAFDEWREAEGGGALIKIRGLLRGHKDGGQ